MEIEARYFYSTKSKDKIIKQLESLDGLFYDDRYYEKTDQYNHPMKEYDFYSKEIDGRFRIRKTENDKIQKCMITWKRRDHGSNGSIHQEEEIEVSINPSEYDNLILLLTNVLHLDLREL